MATITESQATPARTAAQTVRPPASWSSRLGAFILLAAPLPLLGLHLISLWNRSHYQFFPLLLIACWYFARNRIPRRSQPLTGSSTERRLVGAGLLVLLTATVFYSPWLGALAAVLLFGGVLRHFGGQYTWRLLGPVALLALLILPPPFGFDEIVFPWLNAQVAFFSSHMIDWIGIDHVMEQGVVYLPTAQIVVEEVCSRVDFIYALLVATAIMAVASRRSPFTIVLLLISVVFWSLLANVARVSTIAIAHTEYGLNLAHGWPYYVLSGVVFFAALVLIFCAEAFLYFLFGPVDATNTFRFGPLSRWWNSYIAGVSDEETRELRQAPSGPQSHGKNRSYVANWVALTFALMCLVAQVTMIYFAYHFEIIRSVKSRTIMETVSHDVTESFFGPTAANTTVQIDFVFSPWQDATTDDRAQGWTIAKRRFVRPARLRQAPLMAIEMTKADGSHGYLSLSRIDAAGEYIDPPQSQPAWQWLLSRLQRSPVIALWDAEMYARAHLPIVQLRTFSTSTAKLTDDEQKSVRVQHWNQRLRLQSYWHQTFPRPIIRMVSITTPK